MTRLSLAVVVAAFLSCGCVAQEMPDFVMIGEKTYGSVYEDVLSYSDKTFGNSHGRATNVHETAHWIHARERNKTQGKSNAFYCLEGRVVLLPEPKLTMRHIKIPSALRSQRHKLYFEEQLAYWNDRPTYPLDEWSSYILGAECAVQDHERGIETQKTDAVAGCLEFSIYSIATAMAVKEMDRDYWYDQTNFRRLVKFNLERAERAFFKGRYVFGSDRQERLLATFREHPDADETRMFMRDEFGEFFLHDLVAK